MTTSPATDDLIRDSLAARERRRREAMRSLRRHAAGTEYLTTDRLEAVSAVTGLALEQIDEILRAERKLTAARTEFANEAEANARYAAVAKEKADLERGYAATVRRLEDELRQAAAAHRTALAGIAAEYELASQLVAQVLEARAAILKGCPDPFLQQRLKDARSRQAGGEITAVIAEMLAAD